MRVPAGGLDFYVLSDGIESQVLCPLNVEFQSFVGRGGVETVRPPALVEGAECEKFLVVECEIYASESAVFCNGKFAHSSVALYAVNLFAALV